MVLYRVEVSGVRLVMGRMGVGSHVQKIVHFSQLKFSCCHVECIVLPCSLVDKIGKNKGVYRITSKI